MDGHMSRIFSVQYTPGQDNEFLSGGWDDTVQVIKIFFNWTQVHFYINKTPKWPYKDFDL